MSVSNANLNSLIHETIRMVRSTCATHINIPFEYLENQKKLQLAIGLADLGFMACVLRTWKERAVVGLTTRR